MPHPKKWAPSENSGNHVQINQFAFVANTEVFGPQPRALQTKILWPYLSEDILRVLLYKLNNYDGF